MRTINPVFLWAVVSLVFSSSSTGQVSRLLDEGKAVQALAMLPPPGGAGVSAADAMLRVRALAAVGRFQEAEDAYRAVVGTSASAVPVIDCGTGALEGLAVPAGRGEKLRYRVEIDYRVGGEEGHRIVRRLGRWNLDLDWRGERAGAGETRLDLHSIRVRRSEGPLRPPTAGSGQSVPLRVSPSFGLFQPDLGAGDSATQVWSLALSMLFPPATPVAVSGGVQAIWLLPGEGQSVAGWLCHVESSQGHSRRWSGELSTSTRDLVATLELDYRSEAGGFVLQELRGTVQDQLRESLSDSRLVEVDLKARLLRYEPPAEPIQVALSAGSEEPLAELSTSEQDSSGLVRVKPDSLLVLAQSGGVDPGTTELSQSTDSDLVSGDPREEEWSSEPPFGDALDSSPDFVAVSDIPGSSVLEDLPPVGSSAPVSSVPDSPLVVTWSEPPSPDAAPFGSESGDLEDLSTAAPVSPTGDFRPKAPVVAGSSDHPARRLLKQRKYDQALSLLNTEFQSNPTAETYLLLAITYEALGKDDRAALVFAHKALTRQSTPETHAVAGELYHRLGFYREAIEHLRQAGPLLDHDKRFAFGDSLVREGDQEEGKAVLLELLASSPSGRVAEMTRERLESL